MIKKFAISKEAGIPTSSKDSLLREITFEDLIIAAQSNEPEINEASLKKVFQDMLKDNIEEAWVEFKSNLPWMLKQAK